MAGIYLKYNVNYVSVNSLTKNSDIKYKIKNK